MPEIWKNKLSKTAKRNANLKHYYMCSPESTLPAYALLFFYIKFLQLLRILLFYICICRPAF